MAGSTSFVRFWTNLLEFESMHANTGQTDHTKPEQIEEAISRWQYVQGFAGITRTEIENTVKSAYRRSDK